MATKKPLRWTRGTPVFSVSGTIQLTAWSDGLARIYEIDHADTPTNEDASLLGRFAFAALPEFGVAAGFTVQPVLDGMTGSCFRVWITCDYDEVVYEPYGYPPYGLDPYTPEPGTGTVTLTYTRRGVLSDDA